MGHPKWKCLGWMNKVYTQGKYVLGIKELIFFYFAFDDIAWCSYYQYIKGNCIEFFIWGFGTQNILDCSINWEYGQESGRESWEQVQEVREGTIILVDWGICRIHKVPTWQNGQYGDRCFWSPVIHHQASLPLGTHQGREIINAPCSLVISLPQVIPPLMWVYL